MSTLTAEQLAELKPHEVKVFNLLEQAAIAGLRCPKRRPFGPMPRHGTTGRLERLGFIRAEVFSKNFRRVTILVGPHAGRRTASPPDPNSKPYRVGAPAPVTLHKIAP